MSRDVTYHCVMGWTGLFHVYIVSIKYPRVNEVDVGRYGGTTCDKSGVVNVDLSYLPWTDRYLCVSCGKQDSKLQIYNNKTLSNIHFQYCERF